LGASTDTVRLWKSNRNSPKLGYIPKIIEFLGYLPDLGNQTSGQKLKTYRITKGLTQKAFARILGVDPNTLGEWDKGRGRLPERV
jgi:DNA-binding transcriptional regulator YiaG